MPYAGYRGGALGRLGVGDLLARLPSPYWWFREPRFDDVTGDELLRVLRGLVATEDPSVRFLNVGCFEGALLDQLKRDTGGWQTFGVETNAAVLAVARSRGHAVWKSRRRTRRWRCRWARRST